MFFVPLLLLPLLVSSTQITITSLDGETQVIANSHEEAVVFLIKQSLDFFDVMFHNERAWTERVLTGKDGCDEAWETVKESHKAVSAHCTLLKRFMSKSSAKVRALIKSVNSFENVSFSKLAIEKFAAEKNPVKHHSSIETLPEFFKNIANILKIDIKDHRVKWYRYIYSGGTAEMETLALDADFKKYCFDGDILKTSAALHIGCLNKSMKAVKMYNDFMHHHRTKSGWEGVEKIFRGCFGNRLDYMMPMLKSRKDYICTVSDSKNPKEFLANSRCEPSKHGEIEYYSHMNDSKEVFETYFQELHEQGHIAPHPITGKLLFTKNLIASEARKLIKALKLMICMNMYIPRLALTEEEYQSANEISKSDLFAFNKDLVAEVNKVTTDISAHYNSRSRIHIKQCETLDQLLQEDVHLSHQLSFMLTGEYTRSKAIECAVYFGNESSFSVVREPEAQVYIDATLSKEQYRLLLENMSVTEKDGSKMFFCSLESANCKMTINAAMRILEAALISANEQVPECRELVQEQAVKVVEDESKVIVVQKEQTSNSPSSKDKSVEVATREIDLDNFDLEHFPNIDDDDLNDIDVDDGFVFPEPFSVDAEVKSQRAAHLATRMAQVGDRYEMAAVLIDLISTGSVKIDLIKELAENDEVKRAFESMLKKAGTF